TAAAYRELANFGARIERIHDIDALIDAGLQDLARQLRLDLGVYYVIEGHACHVARSWGAMPPGLERLHDAPMPVGQGLVGTVAATGREHLVPDYPGWPGALPEYVQIGLRTQFTLPIQRNGATVGVVSLASFGRKVELGDDDRVVAGSFVKRLENALERVESIRELTATREQTFRALGVALEYRDLETKGHTDRVVERALAFGRAVGMGERELQALQWGAYLHDLGKIAIPDDILLKPGRLTDEEFRVIRNHTIYGYEMTRGIPFLPEATRALVRNHHERWQGDGYPDGLAGDAIPLMARMFSLVDVYDALMSDRPYKRAWTHEAAIREIRGMAGIQFDPELTEVFLELVEDAPHRS
ncbi:MAG: HD domain-containing protein, partial [Deinococcales bacterium]